MSTITLCIVHSNNWIFSLSVCSAQRLCKLTSSHPVHCFPWALPDIPSPLIACLSCRTASSLKLWFGDALIRVPPVVTKIKMVPSMTGTQTLSRRFLMSKCHTVSRYSVKCYFSYVREGSAFPITPVPRTFSHFLVHVDLFILKYLMNGRHHESPRHAVSVLSLSLSCLCILLS